MGFLNTDFGGQYLDDFYNDRIPAGLGMGLKAVDERIAFKQSQYNIVIGVDNVGKTDFLLWYYLVLALKHNKKIDIWSGENKPEQQKRKLIQMYSGLPLKKMDYKDIQKCKMIIESCFNWVDRNKLYSHTDLLKIFADSDSDICFIDPINGLDHKLKFGSTDMTYKFSNDVRQFCNNTDKSVFVSAHTVSEAARRQYPKEHELGGYQMPPIKSMIEGGQPFASRADDFWIVNRLINHEFLQYFTQVEIVKVKDTETGGKPTMKDAPLCFEFNYGLGYRYSEVDILNPATFHGALTDPLDGLRMGGKKKEPEQITIESAIKPNKSFENPVEIDNNNSSDWFSTSKSEWE